MNPKLFFANRQKSYSASKKRCYYDVLGVAQEADQKEIRSSYVSKTKEVNPIPILFFHVILCKGPDIWPRLCIQWLTLYVPD